MLFGRVSLIEDNKSGYSLYVVPKVIKSIKNVRANLKKEEKSLSRDTKMLMPVLVGEFNINRYDLNKICKEDTILKNNINSMIFTFWSFDKITCDINSFYQKIYDIQMRLQLILKKVEMNYPLGFDKFLRKNIINHRGFVKVRKYQSIEEDKEMKF